MSAARVIDTQVLVYRFDPRDGPPREIYPTGDFVPLHRSVFAGTDGDDWDAFEAEATAVRLLALIEGPVAGSHDLARDPFPAPPFS
jgi:hypothetical protein